MSADTRGLIILAIIFITLGYLQWDARQDERRDNELSCLRDGEMCAYVESR